MRNPDIGRLTKRFIMCLVGCGMIYYFLDKHRAWTWAFFETLLSYKTIPPELAAVAQACITSLTTVANVAITAIAGIVFFLVTGNVMALRSFNFSSAAQATATLASTSAVNVSETIQKEIKEAAQKFAGDPSYRPAESLPDKDTPPFR